MLVMATLCYMKMGHMCVDEHEQPSMLAITTLCCMRSNTSHADECSERFQSQRWEPNSSAPAERAQAHARSTEETSAQRKSRTRRRGSWSCDH